VKEDGDMSLNLSGVAAEEEPPTDTLPKVYLIGPAKSGKSSFVQQLLNHSFIGDYHPTNPEKEPYAYVERTHRAPELS
jgi:polynucleotide 5'-kinase involved in rRNA processing